jgi:hypothetical protein
MPVTLLEPKQTKVLDKAKIAAFKVERNVEQWIEVWVVYGYEEKGEFVQQIAPEPGGAILHLKIEDGAHPLAPGMALGRCDSCGRWYSVARGSCLVESCSGTVRPYDGYTRLASLPPTGGTIYEAIRDVLYDFLTTERVPLPDDFAEIRPLLAGVK